MPLQPIALPAAAPVVDWDADRGVFLLGLGNPEWEAVRRARVGQLEQPAPIVNFHRRHWRDALRRFARRAGAVLKALQP